MTQGAVGDALATPFRHSFAAVNNPPVLTRLHELPPDIAARIRNGDEAAFEQAFRAHYAELCGFARRYTNDCDRAEELVQDLFTDLWARRTTLAVRGGLRAYLYAAMRNRCLNARQRQLIERDWLERERTAELHDLHHDRKTDEDPVVNAETEVRVRRAIAALPERCRTTMELRWYRGLNYAEIAQAMGISVKGVENQLARGLKSLRERLQ